MLCAHGAQVTGIFAAAYKTASQVPFNVEVMETIEAVRSNRPGARCWVAPVCLSVLLTSAWSSACTPTLSTMEPARLTPPGHVQITTSASGTLPTGEPMSLLRDLQRVSKSEKLNLDSAEELALGTASLLVNAPGMTSTASISVGLNRQYEISARVSTSAARFGMRHQLFRARPGVYGVVGLGLTQYFAPLDIETFSNRAQIHSFSRQEVDVPLHLGISGRVGHLWLGPKLVFARYDADVSACLDITGGVCRTHGRMNMRGTAMYSGGQFGIALGHRRFWIAAELSALHLGANADLNVNVSGIKSRVPFTPDGWLFSPAIGVITWF